MLGHMLGAAGGVEAIALVMEDIIQPTINLALPDPECDLDYVSQDAKKKELNIGISNSFGFGGLNSAIVLKKYK